VGAAADCRSHRLRGIRLEINNSDMSSAVRRKAFTKGLTDSVTAAGYNDDLVDHIH
jgi:hypothetical protein